MASSSSASRNPFLSPSQTASSQSEPPNIHTAFANINLANPQPASSPSSRNPFLDAHRSPYPSGSQPPVGTQTAGSSPFSDKDLDFLDGTSSRPQQPAVVVVEEARRKGGEGLDSEEGLSESERREWEQHVENERRESERGRGGDPGPAVSNGDYQDDDEALQAAIRASLAGSDSAPPASSSTSQPSYPSPAGPPPLPNRPSSSLATPTPTLAPAHVSPPQTHVIPPENAHFSEEPPPAYSLESSASHSTTLDAGPPRPAFAQAFSQPTGPPPPLQSQPTGWSDGGGNPGGFISPQPTGPASAYCPPPQQHVPPPPVPHRTNTIHAPPLSSKNSSSKDSSYRPSPPLQQYASSSGPPPPPRQNLLPSETPIVGRPFMNDGKVLVYPAGFFCSKCNNTGFKENDPSHPCRTSCWKRYGKPFSFVRVAWDGLENRQRPLGVYRPPPLHPGLGGGYPGAGFGPGNRPPGGYTVGGGGGYGYGGIMPHAPPPGSVVYHPGDPRIGGQLCWRCGGHGETIGLFLSSDRCQTCRGVGRIF